MMRDFPHCFIGNSIMLYVNQLTLQSLYWLSISINISVGITGLVSFTSGLVHDLKILLHRHAHISHTLLTAPCEAQHLLPSLYPYWEERHCVHEKLVDAWLILSLICNVWKRANEALHLAC